MTEEKKNINLGFRATASRQEQLKIAAAKRRQSVQEMIEEALEKLLVDAYHDADLTESLGIVLRDGNEAMRDEARRLLKGLALKVRALQSVEPERETRARVGRR